jgi:hypothetical protein
MLQVIIGYATDDMGVSCISNIRYNLPPEQRVSPIGNSYVICEFAITFADPKFPIERNSSTSVSYAPWLDMGHGEDL